MRISTTNSAGFTLVELLVGTTIFAIIMALLLSVMNSFEATGDIKVTQKRMTEIAAKAGEYYLSRENLPLPHDPATNLPVTTSIVGEVPVTALHLDQKYRLDSWGQPMQYFTVRNDGAGGRPGQILIDPLSAGAPAGSPAAMVDIPQADLTATPPTGKTLITGVLVNNRQVAGVLISNGPNNVPEYTQTAGYPEQFVLDAGSDDIILAIDLTPQATRVAQTELKKLGEKVRAFDDRYIGKDNNGDGQYDEDGCNPVPYPGGTISLYRNGNAVNPCTQYPVSNFTSSYLPIPVSLAGTLADYSCGSPSLDDMKANYWGNNPTYGYYYPQIIGYGRLWDPMAIPPIAGAYVVCQILNTPAEYYRVPMNLNNAASDDCHWGLVGDSNYVFPTGQANSDLTNDQARAAIFCAYGLSPADIVDPWLNGYTWGCGQGSGQGGSQCANEYPDTDPRFHKFYSAGPDQQVNTQDDIVAPL